MPVTWKEVPVYATDVVPTKRQPYSYSGYGGGASHQPYEPYEPSHLSATSNTKGGKAHPHPYLHPRTTSRVLFPFNRNDDVHLREKTMAIMHYWMMEKRLAWMMYVGIHDMSRFHEQVSSEVRNVLHLNATLKGNVIVQQSNRPWRNDMVHVLDNAIRQTQSNASYTRCYQRLCTTLFCRLLDVISVPSNHKKRYKIN